MNTAFTVLLVGSCAIVCFSLSVIASTGLRACDRVCGRLDATGRARAWLTMALFPAFGALLVVVATFGPWLGLAHDHCLEDVHAHLHLCFAHPAEVIPILLVLPAAALAARLVARSARAAIYAARSARLSHELAAASTGRIGDAWVLGIDEPKAFVLGLLRPRLFVTSGLLLRSPEDVATVLAHERAHATRRDPLRRVAASFALAFHLPGVADALERRLGLAHEMAADAHAASEVGGPLQVASALVNHARLHDRAPAITARVRELLCEAPRQRAPTARTVAVASAAAVAGAALAADTVHHLLEHALALLGA